MSTPYKFADYQAALKACLDGTPYANSASSLKSKGPQNVNCKIIYTRASSTISVESDIKLPDPCILVIPCACVYIYVKNGYAATGGPKLKCLVNISDTVGELGKLVDNINQKITNNNISPDTLAKLDDQDVDIGCLFTGFKIADRQVTGLIGSNSVQTVAQSSDIVRASAKDLEIRLTTHPTKSDLIAVLSAYKYIRGKVDLLCSRSGVCGNPYAAACGVNAGGYNNLGSFNKMALSCKDITDPDQSKIAYTPIITIIDLFLDLERSGSTPNFLCTKQFFDTMSTLIKDGKTVINKLSSISNEIDENCKSRPDAGSSCNEPNGTVLYDQSNPPDQSKCVPSSASGAYIGDILFPNELENYYKAMLKKCPKNDAEEDGGKEPTGATVADLISYGVGVDCFRTDVNDQLEWTHSSNGGNQYTAYIPSIKPSTVVQLYQQEDNDLEEGEYDYDDSEDCHNWSGDPYTVILQQDQCQDGVVTPVDVGTCTASMDGCGMTDCPHVPAGPALSDTTYPKSSSDCTSSELMFHILEHPPVSDQYYNPNGPLCQINRGASSCGCDPTTYQGQIFHRNGIYASRTY